MALGIRSRGREGFNRSLIIIILMESIALLTQSTDDHLDVPAGGMSHLIAHRLRLLGEAGGAHTVAHPSQLMPHLLALTIAVAVQPVRAHAHTDFLSCRAGIPQSKWATG